MRGFFNRSTIIGAYFFVVVGFSGSSTGFSAPLESPFFDLKNNFPLKRESSFHRNQGVVTSGVALPEPKDPIPDFTESHVLAEVGERENLKACGSIFDAEKVFNEAIKSDDSRDSLLLLKQAIHCLNLVLVSKTQVSNKYASLKQKDQAQQFELKMHEKICKSLDCNYLSAVKFTELAKVRSCLNRYKEAALLSYKSDSLLRELPDHKVRKLRVTNRELINNYNVFKNGYRIDDLEVSNRCFVRPGYWSVQ